MKFKFREYLFQDYLEDNEEIFFVGHRVIFIMFRDSARIIAIHGVLPFILWLFFPNLIWIFAGIAILGIIRMLLVVQDWFYDCWLVTNMGIIGVEWTGFFDRTSDRVEYQSIEGISYKIKGVMPTMFNYGNITLAKLGAQTSVKLNAAYNPKRIEKNVIKYQDKFMTKKNFTDQEVLKQLLSELVATHVQEHGLPNEAMNKDKLKEFTKKK
jgi:predicted membrane metal-binding protein